MTDFKVNLTLAGKTLAKIIRENNYIIRLVLGGKPDLLVITKDEQHITSVNLDETIEYLLNRSNTYLLYINRQNTNKVKLDRILDKTLKVSQSTKEKIEEEYIKDSKIIYNLIYHRAIRQAIQQSKELRNLFK